MTLPSRRSVLGLVHDVDAADFERAARRFERAYAAIPALAPARLSTRYVHELRVGICVVAPTAIDLEGEPTLVWGEPLGRAGRASDDEIRTALATPSNARDLTGIFVLMQVQPAAIRVVTSAALVATLRRAGSAFATRASAAAILNGGPVEVRRDAVLEAVLWQCSLGTGGEVLAGVQPLEAATVIDLTRAGPPSVTSYWSPAAMLAPDVRTTPEAFRALVGEQMSTVAGVPEAMLGLTAGLDSTLAASCLAATGGRIKTFTIGHRGYPDLVAARAVAKRLGWSHETVETVDAIGTPVLRRGAGRVPGEDRVSWLVRHAPWGDGLAHPRDAVLGRMRWRRRDALWVSGLGGETLRAVYGSALRPGDVADNLGRQVAEWAAPKVRGEFTETIREEVRAAKALRDDADAIDLVYLRRQFTWIDRPLPLEQVADSHPLFMNARVIRAMLDVPAAERGSGEFVRRTHLLAPEDLSHLGAKAADKVPWTARLPRRRRRSRYVDDWPLLHGLLTQLEPDGLLARDVLGDDWYRWAVGIAPEQPWIRAPLWHAVAIETLHRFS